MHTYICTASEYELHTKEKIFEPLPSCELLLKLIHSQSDKRVWATSDLSAVIIQHYTLPCQKLSGIFTLLGYYGANFNQLMQWPRIMHVIYIYGLIGQDVGRYFK